MKFFRKIQEKIEEIKNWDYETLEGAKYFTIFLIIVDLFGVYWFLGQKRLGVFLLFAFIGVLACFFAFQKGKTPRKDYTPPLDRLQDGFEQFSDNLQKSLPKGETFFQNPLSDLELEVPKSIPKVRLLPKGGRNKK